MAAAPPLASEIRCSKRLAFEEKMSKKEEEQEAQKLLDEKQKIEQEEKLVKEIRKTSCFKATPVRRYK